MRERSSHYDNQTHELVMRYDDHKNNCHAQISINDREIYSRKPRELNRFLRVKQYELAKLLRKARCQKKS